MSTKFSRSVVSDSLRPHESQHTRPPCPSPTPGIYMSIELVMPSSHLILCCPLSSCPQSLPASESFPMSQLFTWGGCYYIHTLNSTLSSVQLSRSAVSNSLQPHELQHARLPCPSPTPRACSNSCPLSRWCYPTISSSVVPSPPAFYLSQHHGLS